MFLIKSLTVLYIGVYQELIFFPWRLDKNINIIVFLKCRMNLALNAELSQSAVAAPPDQTNPNHFSNWIWTLVEELVWEVSEVQESRKYEINEASGCEGCRWVVLKGFRNSLSQTFAVLWRRMWPGGKGRNVWWRQNNQII